MQKYLSYSIEKIKKRMIKIMFWNIQILALNATEPWKHLKEIRDAFIAKNQEPN